MNLFEKAKPYPITKEQVWEAYKQVRSNKGAAGIDGLTIEQIEQNSKKYLYPVWNRLASGSYFPSAVKRVEIPKADGTKRSLGIPTVLDRVAQQVIASELEEIVDKHFHPSSFGYRPAKSAHQAIEQAKQNCWKHNYVVDMDIKGFFDNIDHGLMIRALRRFTNRKHIITYCKRWLKAGVYVPGEDRVVQNCTGTPQGGVISPLLANIFLHFAFDTWMKVTYPNYPFERYADDIIIHCATAIQARELLTKVKHRLQQCNLETHPSKTKIVFCKRNDVPTSKAVQFDFLGCTFRPRKAVSKKGKTFVSFGPVMSTKAQSGILKGLAKDQVHRWTNNNLQSLAIQLAPKIRGWLNYYGKVNKAAMFSFWYRVNTRIIKWALNKYKRFKRMQSWKMARKWVKGMAKCYPYLFPHWQAGFLP